MFRIRIFPTILSLERRCDKFFYYEESNLVFQSKHYHQNQIQSPEDSDRNTEPNKRTGPLDLSSHLERNFAWINSTYERIIGVTELRQIHAKVLEAEYQFVDISARRKECQDRLDNLKNHLIHLKEKLDSTPRASDTYLTLITNEHNLYRESKAIEDELKTHKEKEQRTFDILSKLLRSSHELERLRQERSRYSQLIYLFGSILVSVLYRWSYLNDDSGKEQKNILENSSKILSGLVDLQYSVDRVASSHEKLVSKLDIASKTINEVKKPYCYTAWIPGFSYLTYMLEWFY